MSRGSAARLRRLSRRVGRAGLDALVVTHLPNVRYLTGFTGTSGAVVVDGRGGTFVTDFRYRLQAQKQVRAFRLFEQRAGMGEALAEVLGRRRRRRVGFEKRHISWAMHRELSRRIPGARLVPRNGDVEALRAVKDSDEIALIRRAIRIAAGAYGRGARRLVGRREIEVAEGIERAMREGGAEAAAFPAIVASGANSALPHASPGRRTVRSGDSVILDFGARCRGYHSDTTRTRLCGGGTPRGRDIYRVVQEAQRAALEAVRPGAAARDVDRAARRVIEEAGFGAFFGHGTGHGVGLEVHENPSISPKSGDILSPGMVFTLEPGVYIEKFGGVRIEDMVLVTEKGCEIMTRSIRRESL